ncbi:hypothetical protein CLO_3671 [Clostridium botulinum E1 str. 'BoNT E Beluga']|nr:hypothetical protein CLO_3671 [Clostridium botulinum E1 str. 'BoNT E Beluga']
MIIMILWIHLYYGQAKKFYTLIDKKLKYFFKLFKNLKILDGVGF